MLRAVIQLRRGSSVTPCEHGCLLNQIILWHIPSLTGLVPKRLRFTRRNYQLGIIN